VLGAHRFGGSRIAPPSRDVRPQEPFAQHRQMGFLDRHEIERGPEIRTVHAPLSYAAAHLATVSSVRVVMSVPNVRSRRLMNTGPLSLGR
jgi:hypothetical protein